MSDAAVAEPADDIRWQASNPTELLRERFEDEYFVFNPASGHTHLLNALGVMVFDLIAEQPRTEQALLALLRQDAEPAMHAQLAQALSDHLGQLAVIGLIAPADD